MKKIKVSPKIEKQNEALMAKLKKKGHKVKVKYKYAEKDGVWLDRPKTSAYQEEKLLIDGPGFLRDYAALCVKHLKGTEKDDRTLAMCQIEDRSHIFIDTVKPTVLAALKWNMK